MNRRRVTIVRTGVGNIASVIAAFERLDLAADLTDDPASVRDAELLVLPGVGAFGAAMAQLRERDLVQTLFERFAANRPTLAICLGLQLLCTSSEESPGDLGLCVMPESISRLSRGLPVPQIGWNEVVPYAPCRYLSRGFAYYSNSYCLPRAPTEWSAAYTDFGGPFVAAVERGRILACQFHPELSGTWGLDLLRRWIANESVSESAVLTC